MSSGYPRGSAGAVLTPGTRVRVNGLRSTAGRAQNGSEGVCERWDASKGVMYVRFEGGMLRGFSPRNLQKVRAQDQNADPNVARIVAIFQANDVNGDGILDTVEFGHILKALGLPQSSVPQYLHFVDKDGDNHVSYEEFVSWALAPSGKAKAAQSQPPAVPSVPERLPEDPDDPGEEEEGDDYEELTLEDIERICRGQIRSSWPAHGVQIVNNMHQRFPEFPVEGIVLQMYQHNYVGGQVMAAIRQTGTPEVETVPPSAVRIGQPGAFPSFYRNRRNPEAQLGGATGADAGTLNVYEESGRNWSFKNMRDARLPSVGVIGRGQRFEVLEVRRGDEYGFCFGKISKGPPAHWVVLGLEMNKNILKRDSQLSTDELQYSDAERISKFEMKYGPPPGA